jgi:CRISPR-associated endonuclease Csn1
MTKIGLDVGSSSLGWIVTDDGKIVKKGVITFDTGMSKGQRGYVSPTRERREARSKRNLIRAKKYKKWELLEVLVENDCVPLSQDELETWSKYKKGQSRKFPENEKFLQWLKCDFSYLGIETEYKNPYELRVNALDNKLSKHEFGRALYHLVQRRGYKDIGETDTETEKQIAR